MFRHARSCVRGMPPGFVQSRTDFLARQPASGAACSRAPAPKRSVARCARMPPWKRVERAPFALRAAMASLAAPIHSCSRSSSSPRSVWCHASAFGVDALGCNFSHLARASDTESRWRRCSTQILYCIIAKNLVTCRPLSELIIAKHALVARERSDANPHIGDGAVPRHTVALRARLTRYCLRSSRSSGADPPPGSRPTMIIPPRASLYAIS